MSKNLIHVYFQSYAIVITVQEVAIYQKLHHQERLVVVYTQVLGHVSETSIGVLTRKTGCVHILLNHVKHVYLRAVEIVKVIQKASLKEHCTNVIADFSVYVAVKSPVRLHPVMHVNAIIMVYQHVLDASKAVLIVKVSFVRNQICLKHLAVWLVWVTAVVTAIRHNFFFDIVGTHTHGDY